MEFVREALFFEGSVVVMADADVLPSVTVDHPSWRDGVTGTIFDSIFDVMEVADVALEDIVLVAAGFFCSVKAVIGVSMRSRSEDDHTTLVKRGEDVGVNRHYLQLDRYGVNGTLAAMPAKATMPTVRYFMMNCAVSVKYVISTTICEAVEQEIFLSYLCKPSC